MAWSDKYDQQYGALNTERDRVINAVSSQPASMSGAGIVQSYIKDIERQMQAVVSAREAEAATINAGSAASSPAADPDAFAKAQAAETERRRRINAIGEMKGLMEQYGLSSLMAKITSYIQEGYEKPAIMTMIRTTPEYKERFPAMEALAKKQRAISEAEYIEFERNAAQLERAFGLPVGLLDDKDTVTNLLTNEVSARELEQRVEMAAAGAFQTTPEVREQFSRLYGIGSGGLTAYFLDPEKALPLLNKQYVSSQIAAEGYMQQFDVERQTAERLTEMGVSREQARAGFRSAARYQPLTSGRGDVVTTGELLGSELFGEQEATRSIERAQAGRLGRFQQGGGFTTDAGGAQGLRRAATR